MSEIRPSNGLCRSPRASNPERIQTELAARRRPGPPRSKHRRVSPSVFSPLTLAYSAEAAMAAKAGHPLSPSRMATEGEFGGTRNFMGLSALNY